MIFSNSDATERVELLCRRWFAAPSGGFIQQDHLLRIAALDVTVSVLDGREKVHE